MSHRLAKWGPVCAVLAVLSACTSTGTPTSLTQDSHGDIKFSTVKGTFERTLSGRTIFFSDDSHGTQIEYFAENGEAYLWYRGNRAANVGEWRSYAPQVEKNPGPPIGIGIGGIAVCFRYSPRSYNPVTNRFGGQWQCEESTLFAERITAIVDGDPFNLQSGTLPAVMPSKSSLTIGEILELTPAQETLNYIYKR